VLGLTSDSIELGARCKAGHRAAAWQGLPAIATLAATAA